LDEDDIINKLDENIRRILDYKAFRDMDIPILNLEIESETFRIGPVSFHSMTDEDRKDDDRNIWWKNVEGALGDSNARMSAISFARVKSPGDIEKSIDYASNMVDEILLLIRAIGFPISTKDVPQIGVLNDFSISTSRPFRPQNLRENYRIDFDSKFVKRIGHPIYPLRLHNELLNSINPDILTLLINLIEENGIYPKGEMEAKLMTGLRWIGEATKPDNLSARFVKLTFALEAIIGGESNEEWLTTRGITATLAERAAFLFGESQPQRLQIDKDVKKYYRIRSDIVHGSGYEIADEDLENFGNLVRSVAWATLEKLDDFKNIDSLQKWIVNQRYSMGHER